MAKKRAETGRLNALLEVGVEEIPARFMGQMLSDLGDKAGKELGASRINFGCVKTFGTARRLVLYIEGLPQKQEDIVEERKGPPKERAYGPDGKPNQAAVGFAKSLGLGVGDLETRTVEGKEYVFATRKVRGLPAEDVLAGAFPKILSSLYLPITMKWGAGEHRFIRPVHWILAVFGSKTVRFEFSGIKSSDSTRGHRYTTGAKPLKVKAPVELEKFRELLLKNGVVLDQDERKKSIRGIVSAAAKRVKGEALIEDDLLEEVTYLVESPAAAAGSFDKRFLALPKDILITSMKKNQKYFPVLDGADRLKPSFVLVADCPDPRTAQATALGNERVLTARLSDAKFFFDEDRKTSLSSRVEELKRVGFYKNLGTLHDKVKRIKELSSWLCKELKVNDPSAVKVVDRTAHLSKADLVTKMVFELPALQGVMGREYALASGEDRAVADGIFEHYLPRFSGDILPKSVPGAVVSIADKLDSVAGCFGVGAVPTGSEDPYALRRQAAGVVEIILNRKLSVSLENAVERSYRLYEHMFGKAKDVKIAALPEVRDGVLSFMAQRLRAILMNNGVRYDVADAVLSRFSDVLFAERVAGLIMKSLKSELLQGIVTTSDRVARISKPAEKEQVVESDLVDDEEKSLYQLYLKVNWEVGSSIDSGDLGKAFQALGSMSNPVDVFFEKVLVMHKDERIKVNRLALLKSIDIMYKSLADFPKIQV